MNKLILISTLSIIFIASCNNDNDKADAYGNFEAKEIIISSEIPGEIMQLNIEEGDLLEQGKPVGLIDTTNLYLQKKILKAQKKSVASKHSGIMAQLNVLKEQKKVLLIEKKRIYNLLKDSVATQKQADDINGKIDILNSQFEQITSQNQNLFDQLKVFDVQIENINHQIQKAKLINPVNGTVLTKYAEENELTSPGKPVYKIADLSQLKLRAYISEDQMTSFKIGQKVKVSADNTDNSMNNYEGIISRISNEAEFTPKIIQTKEERVNLVYSIIITVKNDGSLKIGMPGEVRLIK